MTQGELEKIPDKIVKAMNDLEIRIMDDIVRRIKINGFSTASADWMFTRLKQLGMSEQEIREWVRMALDTSEEEIEKIYSDTVYEEYMKHKRGYEVYGKEQIPFDDNTELQHLIEAVKRQTSDELERITGSMGFVKQGATGKIEPITLTEFYTRTLDDAMYDIHSGAFDYNTVLERTINDMTKSGLRWIDYESGWHNRVPVAARRAVMTGFRQVQGKINEQTAEALGCDTYEVTVHIGARPTHQVWEGRVWTMYQLQTVCGLGTGPGLHGWNCYHDYNVFFPGVSERAYTDEELDQIHKQENTPKTYNGKEYTTYEALQRQRQLETRARKYREDVHLLEEGGGSEEQIQAKKCRYQGVLQEYKDFSKKMDLPMQKERIYQDGLKVDIPERDLSKVAAARPETDRKQMVLNKEGKEVAFDFKTITDKRKKQIDVISELTTEYNTRLERVTYGAENAAGDVDITGTLMRISDNNIDTAVHEFAHTLANTDADKYGLTNDQEFWKEIKKIRREYNKDVKATHDYSRVISSYANSGPLDEFFAEAFTHAKMREMGLPIPDKYGQDFTYSQKVLDTANKYFGKDVRESGRLARLAEQQARKESLQEMLKNSVTIGTPYIEPEKITSQAFRSKFSKINEYEGIPKSWGAPIEISSEEAIRNANPKFEINSYGKTELPYNTNCANCVVAAEMRFRGYPVIARAKNENRKLAADPFSAWKNVEPATLQFGKIELDDFINRLPDQSRVQIAVKYPKSVFKSRLNHTFIAYKKNNKIYYADPQNGSIIKDIEKEFFDGSSEIKYCRIDNAEISDRGCTACERA